MRHELAIGARLVLMVLSLLTLLTAGCTASSALRKQYEALLAPRTPLGSAERGAHFVIAVSTESANRLLQSALPPGGWKASLRATKGFGVNLALRSLRLEPGAACRDCLRIVASLDLETPLGDFLGARIAATAPTVGIARDGQLYLAFLFSKIRDLETRWPDGLEASFDRWLRARLPPGLGGAVLGAMLAPLIKKLGDEVLGGATRLVAKLWQQLETRARVPLPLPRIGGEPVPLRSFRVRSRASGFEIRVVTTLSAPPGDIEVPAHAGKGLGIFVTGAAFRDVMHLAVRKGWLRNKKKPEIKPPKLTFDWEPDGHVKIGVWRFDRPAGVVYLRGRMELSVEKQPAAEPPGAEPPRASPKREIGVRFHDMRVVATEGDFLFELGVFFASELWGRTHELMKKVLVPERSRLGDKIVVARINALRVLDAGLWVEAELAIERASERAD